MPTPDRIASVPAAHWAMRALRVACSLMRPHRDVLHAIAIDRHRPHYMRVLATYSRNLLDAESARD